MASHTIPTRTAILMSSIWNAMKEYESKWMEPLNNFVMHIDADGIRSGGGNVQNNTHLNQKTHWFANDIIRLWTEWINTTTDNTFKRVLEDSLKNAQIDAQNDYNGLLSKLDKDIEKA